MIMNHCLKKTTTAILLSLSFTTLSAQYYLLPNTCAAGYNPGKINNDIEQTTATGWAVIHNGSATTPQWSSVGNISFPFNFNGSAVTAFKVSTSGVLTFNTAASTVPSYTNIAIPTSAVPEKSVCIWGLKGSGSNDQVRTKSFGTTPNRQQWIQFNSYSSTGSTGWTYWAIVLEETTNKIYIVDQRTYNAPLALTIGVQIDSTLATKTTLSPAEDSQAKLYALDTPADNVYYEFTPGTNLNFDVTSTSVKLSNYLKLSSGPFTITGNLRNLGMTTLSSMDLNYSINSGATVTAPVSGLSIATGGCYTFLHPTPWSPTLAGTYTIKTWASNLNANNDQEALNDTVTIIVAVHGITTNRMAMIEEFTQASNAPSAVQNLQFNNLVSANTLKASNINYHTSWPGIDPMYSFNTVDPTTRVFYYNVNALSYVLVNGMAPTGLKYPGSPDNLTQAMIDTAYNQPGLFTIACTAEYNGNQLTINGSTTSLLNTVTGPFKVHVSLFEDYVSYFNAPGTNGETFFPRVMRAMFPSGAGTSIGSPVNGQVDNFTYNYTIPTALNVNNLRMAVFVQDESSKEIYQSAVSFVLPVGMDEAGRTISAFSIYPNPSKEMVNISFRNSGGEGTNITIYNMTGEKVYSYSSETTNGENKISLNTQALADGIYLVSINSGNQVVSKRLVIQK